ncbi:MAG: hypothetical protein ACD_26C00117G0001, partial [uncultured bacterium]
MQENNLDDIAIIGGGPAGISAAIYSKYIGKSFKLFEKKTIGWIPESHINLTNDLQGLPALLHTINGTQLIEMYNNSLNKMNILPIENTKISEIRKEGGIFILINEKGNEFHAKSIILTTGTTPRKLGISGEEETENIYYFAYGYADKYKGEDVIVFGSRNSGATAAMYLAERGVRVTIIELKDSIQAKPQYIERLKRLGVNIMLSSKVEK